MFYIVVKAGLWIYVLDVRVAINSHVPHGIGASAIAVRDIGEHRRHGQKEGHGGRRR